MVDQQTAKDTALMAHLMRRAGFGAQYHELEALAEKGYEQTVEELLNPESSRTDWTSTWLSAVFWSGTTLSGESRSISPGG